MVLGKLPVPGRPTIWITVGQGPTALAVGAGGCCLDIFTLLFPFSPLSPSLWETARYRLKYCLKGPINPKKPTNQLLPGDAFSPALLLRLFTREEDCIQNLLCTQRTFGNYWAFAVFRGPDIIANLSDGLKIIDTGFITCDEIGKQLFVIFLETFEAATLTRCLFCSSVNGCGTHLAEIILTFKCFFKIR